VPPPSEVQEGDRTRPSAYTLSIGGTRPAVTSGYTKMRATSVLCSAAGGVALGDGAGVGAEGDGLGEGDGTGAEGDRAAPVAAAIDGLARSPDLVGRCATSTCAKADASGERTTPTRRLGVRAR
jgi:hypothetical protein